MELFLLLFIYLLIGVLISAITDRQCRKHRKFRGNTMGLDRAEIMWASLLWPMVLVINALSLFVGAYSSVIYWLSRRLP
jgi:hypothetical protein